MPKKKKSVHWEFVHIENNYTNNCVKLRNKKQIKKVGDKHNQKCVNTISCYYFYQ